MLQNNQQHNVELCVANSTMYVVLTGQKGNCRILDYLQAFVIALCPKLCVIPNVAIVLVRSPVSEQHRQHDSFQLRMTVLFSIVWQYTPARILAEFSSERTLCTHIYMYRQCFQRLSEHSSKHYNSVKRANGMIDRIEPQLFVASLKQSVSMSASNLFEWSLLLVNLACQYIPENSLSSTVLHYSTESGLTRSSLYLQ